MDGELFAPGLLERLIRGLVPTGREDAEDHFDLDDDGHIAFEHETDAADFIREICAYELHDFFEEKTQGRSIDFILEKHEVLLEGSIVLCVNYVAGVGFEEEKFRSHIFKLVEDDLVHFYTDEEWVNEFLSSNDTARGDSR